MNQETKLVKQAIKLAKKHGNVSIPLLQVKLKITYEDAKWLMEVLQGWHAE